MNSNSPQGFSFKLTKDAKIFIYRHQQQIMVLKDAKAAELIGELEGCSDEEIQMILAVATGQYRFGNENLSEWVRNTKRTN